MKAKKIIKKVLKALLCVLLVLVIVVVGYVSYVFIAYDRIDDMQQLEITDRVSEKIKVGTNQKIISYNIGFCAYTQDFSFFMDGGKESRAKSEESVNEVLKAITAKYTAEESVTNRSLISEGLVEGLNEKLNDSGLYITDVNIINFDFSEAFITAIEEKQVAQQKLLKAETEKQTAITNAEAEAEATRIRAQAEADANKKIKASLDDNVIRSKFYDKWNGELPQAMGSDSVITSIDGGKE